MGQIFGTPCITALKTEGGLHTKDCLAKDNGKRANILDGEPILCNSPGGKTCCLTMLTGRWSQGGIGKGRYSIYTLYTGN